MKILKIAENNKDEISKWRRELHRIPETGLELPQTAFYICEKLRSFGIQFNTYKEHSGISATIGNTKGKCIALRADMDALPIRENTNILYKSENDNMHACGHDCHMAMLLGAAKILKDVEHELPGCVKLLFQAGEETSEGAVALLNDNILEEPHVDAMLSLHMDQTNNEKIKKGDIIVKHGATHASNDEFEFEIIGKSGHAGSPHITIDVIPVVALVIESLQHIVSREISPMRSGIISICGLHAGSGVKNIISNSATVIGTVRCSDSIVRELVEKRFRETLDGICAATRTTYKLNYKHCEPAVSNDEKITILVESTAIELFGAENVHNMRGQAMGAEDLGYFFEKVPGCIFRVCSPGPHSDGIIYPVHNSKMIIDDSFLYRGTALLVQSTINYLQNNDAKRIKEFCSI